jgi:steroid delta-isomerase-like uncharacterized protein
VSEVNREVVRRFHEAAWTRGDLAVAGALLAADLVDHDALAFPGRAPGAEGLLQVVAMVRAALPDLRRELHEQVCEGDRVVTRFTDRGTHRGALLGVPPTGRVVAVRGINVERVRDGRIAELWHVEDLLGLLQQIGAAGPQPSS